MSDTPRTKGEWNRLACLDHPEFEEKLAGFAETLERELAESKAALTQAHKDFGHELRDPNGTIWDECARLQRELGEALARVGVLTEQRDRLAEALNGAKSEFEYLIDLGPPLTVYSACITRIEEIDAALAAVKGEKL